MGIHLIPYKISAGNLSEFKDFDSCRFQGDLEFASTQEIDRIYKTLHDEDIYWRPKDFTKAKQWVIEHAVAEGNRDRLVELLNHMEQDETLWIYNSY